MVSRRTWHCYCGSINPLTTTLCPKCKTYSIPKPKSETEIRLEARELHKQMQKELEEVTHKKNCKCRFCWASRIVDGV